VEQAVKQFPESSLIFLKNDLKNFGPVLLLNKLNYEIDSKVQLSWCLLSGHSFIYSFILIFRRNNHVLFSQGTRAESART
ncbi:hypothetical protein, partial [Paenibacillus typhae]|uniref:hypothetical protein n=1 Tax=Paenibacillus typhae TaxID=1174501 RepID=UPI0039EF5C0C